MIFPSYFSFQNMLLPRGVGHTFAFVSETSFLVSSDLYDEYGLRLYSFNCDLNASNSTTPRAPNHIATYSFPSLVYSQTLGPHVSLIEPGKGAYTGERSKRLFTTSSGSLYVVNLRLIDSKDRFLTMGDFTFFINSSVFDQDFQSLHETGIPVHLPFDSWGSKLSRCLPNVRVQTLSNYIIACEGEQYDFNPLSVARDWHKTFLSGQNRQDSPISFNFGTTTIYSSTAFQKPITTSLPYRHSKCAGPWNIIFVEDWIYLEWVRGFQR